MNCRKKRNGLATKITSAVCALLLVGGVLGFHEIEIPGFWQDNASASVSMDASDIPVYSGRMYVELNQNIPEFTGDEKKETRAFERYSRLDSLGRCGTAYANICKEIMPTEERGDISNVHPTGWQSGVGYNRCHLIGFQLAGENANAQNLITGAGYFNRNKMLSLENEVAEYVKRTNHHVLYRVTPIFAGDELVARGVKMEGWSVEDNGKGICFNVFCFNVFKDNIPKIDYKTGAVEGMKQQYINIGTLSKTYTVKQKLTSAKAFSMNVSAASGNVVCSKYSGSKYLGVTKAGKVTVKKGTPVGTHKMKVKFFAPAKNGLKSKTIYKTVTVTVKKKGSSGENITPTPSVGGDMVYWTPSGSCYHKTKRCRTLARSTTIYSGSVSKAKKLSLRACKVCY